MSAQTEKKSDPIPVEIPHTCLVARTAEAIYVAGQFHTKGAVTPFANLHPVELAKYERMARAAATEVLREPVTL